MGRFADTGLRWLYFLVSLAGVAMVGSGLVLWTVKRRVKLPDPERWRDLAKRHGIYYRADDFILLWSLPIMQTIRQRQY